MNTLKIGFVFTNYNNSQLSLNAIKSIIDNSKQFNTEVQIAIVDNNSTPQEIAILKDGVEKIGLTNVKALFEQTNLGYFKGLNAGVKYLKDTFGSFDYLIIGNNDLIFPKAFFDKLISNHDRLKELHVVSPDLITLDGVHQNPHVISKISRTREIVWDLFYWKYFIAKILLNINALIRGLVERKDYTYSQNEGFIYQGYGACYVLTSKFFNSFDELWCPGFLMGEEFYLSKQLDSLNARFYYLPGLVVEHHDHATISKIPSKLLWSYSQEYHKIYRFFISPYRLKMNNQKNYKEYSTNGK
jgi:GT2 family glycosyltransferase